MEKFVFVVGVPRSGTTLVRTILNQHSDVAICPETHFFSSLVHDGVIKKAKHLQPFDTDEKVARLYHLLATPRAIFGPFWKEPQRINTDELISNFKTSKRTYKDLFELLLKQYAKEKGKKISGEKTPSHLFHIDTLIEWFPDSRVIHMLRDPRAVLLSEIHKSVRFDYPLKKSNPFYNFGFFLWVLAGWRLAVSRHDKYEPKYLKQYRLIRYEDLCLDQETTIRRITDFLGIAFEESMLDPGVVNTSFPDDSAHNPIHRWREKLPKGYRGLLKLLLSRQLARFGYS